jgi:hypothetical protein
MNPQIHQRNTQYSIRMLFLIFFCGGLTVNAQELNRHVIISAEKNIRLESWRITSDELQPDSKVKWSVQKQTLHGGKQENVDLIVIDNGALVITIIPTRGMSVFEVRRGEIRLGWDSPIKEIVHPQFMNLEKPRRFGLVGRIQRMAGAFGLGSPAPWNGRVCDQYR